MSKTKSLLVKMVFVCALFLIVAASSPVVTFADDDQTYVSDNLGKADKAEKDGNTNSISKQKDAGEDETELASSDIGTFEYIKVLFALAVVIILLIAVLKFINRKNSAYQQNNLLKNLGGISVGAQKSVQLLQVGNRMYIVGVGETVSLIKEIDSLEEIEQILSFYENKNQDVTTVPFLTEVLSKLKPTKNVKYEQSASFNDLFNAKLKNIKKERTEELEGWKEKEKDKHE